MGAFAGRVWSIVRKWVKTACGRKRFNRPVLKPQFMIVKAANKRNSELMFTLFVTITDLQNFETFNAPVDVFNKHSELRQTAVEGFLFCG